MSKFVIDKIKSLKESGIRKFFELANNYENVLSLGVGEPDFDTPWEIRKEAIDALREGKTFYTSNSGLLELRQEISSYIFKNTNITYDPKAEIIVTVGASEAIDISLRALVTNGDEVILISPGFVSYEPEVLMTGATPVIINLNNSNGFKITSDLLEKYITKKTKLVLLNYPNNPTGSVLSKEEVIDIANVIIKHDLLLLTDEIYSELTYDKKYFSFISPKGMKERTIYINGFSKAFSMTGRRLGYLCAPVEIAKQIYKIHQFMIMSAPTISQFGAIVALTSCEDAVISMKKEYKKRRNYVYRRLISMGLECTIPEGAFYIFPSIKKTGLSSEDFCISLLEKEKVVVVPGSAFGESGEGYIRISYAYSLEDLKEALDRLENFIKEIIK